MTSRFQCPLDIIDGKILFAEGHHPIPHPVCFGGGLRAFLRWEEKFPFGILTELMAQDVETTRSIPEAVGHFGRREFFNEVGPEGLILSMGRVGGFEKDAGHVC